MMVWATILCHALGPLLVLNEHVTAKDHRTILKDHVQIMVQPLYLESGTVYQDDSALIHTARLMTQWFDEHEESQGIYALSIKRTFVRSGIDFGLAQNQCSSTSERCLMGLKSGLCADHWSSSILNSPNHDFRDFSYSRTRKGPFFNYCHKVGSI